MSVLVDTNVLVAASISTERGHARAAGLLRRVGADGAFLTDHILIETWALLRRRAGHFAAMRFWSGLRESPLRIEPVMLPDLERAQAIAERWTDQEFDLVDCTSFAVMERLGCRRAATFDRDFAVYRYGADRDKAFEILS